MQNSALIQPRTGLSKFVKNSQKFEQSQNKRRNADFVRSLGATAAVDYQREDFAGAYRAAPFDLVVDAVGGEPLGCCCYGRKLSL